MNRTEIFDYLKTNNIKCARIYFSGGNDEGGVDSIVFKHLDNTDITVQQTPVPQKWNPDTHRFEYTRELTIEERVLIALVNPVYEKYHSFAGEFYVDGEVIWDVENNKVVMIGDGEVRQNVPFSESV